MSPRINLNSDGKMDSYNLPIVYKPEENWIVAKCPDLDLAAQGKTKEAAKLALGETIELFFEELEYSGTTIEVLKEFGWTIEHVSNSSDEKQNNMIPPKTETDEIEVGIVKVPA